MKDVAATVLAFLFAQDKEEHPMPSGAAGRLLQKIREFIYGKEELCDGKEKSDAPCD